MGDFNRSFDRRQRESRFSEPQRGPSFQSGPWGDEPYPRRGNSSPRRDHQYRGEVPPWREGGHQPYYEGYEWPPENYYRPRQDWVHPPPRNLAGADIDPYHEQGSNWDRRDHPEPLPLSSNQRGRDRGRGSFRGNRRPKYSKRDQDLRRHSFEMGKHTTRAHSDSKEELETGQQSDGVSQEGARQVDDVVPIYEVAEASKEKPDCSLDENNGAPSNEENDGQENAADPLTHVFDGDIEHCISAATTHMKLSRGTKLVIEASPTSESKCNVPTAPPKLTRRTLRSGGLQNKPWEVPVKSTNPTTLVILNPVLDEAPDFPTKTLAQEFIRCPEKRWRRDSASQLEVGLPYVEKFYIWARMMLMAEEDKQMLERAGVLRGVFAALFRVRPVWPLIQAFIDFWNVDGHTVITSQGETGYPLLLVDDAMGIPISGRAYDEFIPPPFCAEDSAVTTLHAVYAKLCQHRLAHGTEGKGLVKVTEWTDYFLQDKERLKDVTEVSYPVDFYAAIDDPLFIKNHNFRVITQEDKAPSVLFSCYRMDYKVQCSRLEYRAAFVAAWLCLYCIPVDMGNYIRPEVFSAAVSIAKGTRRAIGVASLAHLYGCLDDIHHAVANGTTSASEHRLPLPAHFIMGWFTAYWKAMPSSSTCTTALTKHPPFITDAWKAHHHKIDLIGAHRIFLDVDEQKHALLSLDFVGRLGTSRFPKKESVHLNDCRESSEEERTLKISEIDILISGVVGGVSYRRCQLQTNQVYCPHRFARAHNCDQEVPDFLMDGLLQFSEILHGTMEETTELLTRRLLGHLRPGGHSFELLPRTRPTQRSYEYMRWCVSALSFLQEADVFCNGIDIPLGITKTKLAASASDVLPVVSETSSDVYEPKRRKERHAVPKRSKKAMEGTHLEAPTKFCSEEVDTQTTDTFPNSSNQGNKSEKEDLAETATVQEGKNIAEASPKATVEESLAAPRSVDVVDLETSKPPNYSQDDGKKKHEAVAALKGNEKRKSDPDLSGTSVEVPRKKQKLKGKDLWDAVKSIDQITTLKDNVEQGVLQFCDDVGTAFDSNDLPPPPKRISCKPGAPLQLPESASATTKFAFQQITTGLKNLQALANAEEFDQQAFTENMKSSLDGWEGFFSSHFTPEIARMVSRLKGLQTKLEDESVQHPQDTFENLSARSQRVAEMLEKSTSVRTLITSTRTTIERVKLAGGKDQESLSSLKAEYRKSIRDLEAQIAEQKEGLELIKVMQSKNAEFFEEANAATQVVEESSSRFEEIAAKGDAMNKTLATYSQKIEIVDGLPPPLHALRIVVRSYSIIE